MAKKRAKKRATKKKTPTRRTNSTQLRELEDQRETLMQIVTALMFRFGHDMQNGTIEALVKVPMVTLPFKWRIDPETQTVRLTMQVGEPVAAEEAPTEGEITPAAEVTAPEPEPEPKYDAVGKYPAEEDADLDDFAAGLRGN